MEDKKLKTAIKQLKESDGMLNIIADAVFARSLDSSVILYWSNGAQKLYGYSEKEALGKVKYHLLQSGPPEMLAKGSSELEKNGYWKGNIVHKGKNGDTFYIESVWIVARDIDNVTPLYILELNRDTTSQMILGKIRTYKEEVASTIRRVLKPQLVLQIASDLAVKDFCDFSIIHDSSTDSFFGSVFSNEYLSLSEEITEFFSKASHIDDLYNTGQGQLIPSGSQIQELIPGILPGFWKILKAHQVTSLIILPIITSGNVTAMIIYGTLAQSDTQKFSGNHLEIAKEVIDDVSQRIDQLSLQSQLREEQKRLNDLIDTVPGVVWEAMKNPGSNDQIITYISKDVEEMLGYSTEEWLSTPNFWLKIVHDEDKAKAAIVAKELYEAKKPGVNIFRWVKENGDSIWIESTSITIINENGEAIGMRGVALDISDRVEKDEQKDVFISMASHELKTPVATLKVYAQLMERKLKQLGNADFEKYITKILRQADHITILINDLLNLSRIEQGRLVYHMEREDLSKLVTSTVEELNKVFESHTIKLRDEVKKKLVLKMDSEKIKQVITNVIANAVKYSPESNRVDVSYTTDGENVSISVVDYGIGISKEYSDKVFDKYFRVQDEKGRTFSGMGVGLFITYEILKQHNGNISVKSKKGKGSTFTISLPLH